MLYGQKEKGKKKYAKNIIRRERKKIVVFNQVMRGKRIAFNDFFSTVKSFKNLWCKKGVTFVKLHQV